MIFLCTTFQSAYFQDDLYQHHFAISKLLFVLIKLFSNSLMSFSVLSVVTFRDYLVSLPIILMLELCGGNSNIDFD